MWRSRRSGKEIVLTVVNDDIKALIFSKQRGLAAFTLPNSFSEIRHHLALELDCCNTACDQNLLS